LPGKWHHLIAGSFRNVRRPLKGRKLKFLLKKQADFELSQQRALEQKERYTTDIIKWVCGSPGKKLKNVPLSSPSPSNCKP